MNWVTVKSSNILEVSFEENKILNNGFIPLDLLDVKFKSGAIYRYIGVTKKVYVEFLEAESKGTYLNKEIVGRYQTVQLEKQKAEENV